MKRLCHYTSDHTAMTLARWMTVALLLATCCGCPPAPPSQEEQRRAATSRWITVECGNLEEASEGFLDEDDLTAISQQVPIISTAVAERVRTEMIAGENTDVEIRVSGTGADYLQFLEESARVEVKQGRFLEPVDFEGHGNVIVLSEGLANKLFPNTDPIGSTVSLDGQMLTIVGVVTDGAQWGNALIRDAYVPFGLFDREHDSSAPSYCDRLRFRVERLDQVQNAQQIIQRIFDKRHANQDLRIRSSLFQNEL